MKVLGGGPREFPGVLGGAWEAPKTDDVFSERLGRVLGGSWGGFGALGVVLGSVPGIPNVVISEIILMF